jgi:predicted transcriptional regulator YdeE
MAPQYIIVKLALLTVIGLGVDCPGYDASGIGPAWDRFAKRAAELPAGPVWGVSLPRVDGFYYVAGQQVPAATPVPEGMEAALIPAGDYYCVSFDDHPSKLPETWKRIFEEDLPAAGLETVDGPLALEEYGPGWNDMEHGKFHLKLYVQLKPPAAAAAPDPAQ